MRQFALHFRTLAPIIYPVRTDGNVTYSAREPFSTGENVLFVPKVNGSSIAGRFRRILVRPLFRKVKDKLNDQACVLIANSWSAGSSMDKFLKALYGAKSGGNGNWSFADAVDIMFTRKLAEADPVFRTLGYLIVGASNELVQSSMRFSILYPAHEEVMEKRYSSALQDFCEQVNVKRDPSALKKADFGAGRETITYTEPIETVEFGMKGEFVLSVAQDLKNGGNEEDARKLLEAIKTEKKDGKEKETTKNIMYMVGIAPTCDLVGEVFFVNEEDDLVDAMVSILCHAFSPEVPTIGNAGNYLGIRSSRGFGKVELGIYEKEDGKWERFEPMPFEKAIDTIAQKVDTDTLNEISDALATTVREREDGKKKEKAQSKEE